MKKIIILCLLLAVASGVGGWYYYNTDHRGPGFRTAIAERGELLATINATGTIEPEEVIDIGAQVAGMIKEFGPDPKDPNKRVDYGTEVEKDTVLAQIDPALYKATVDQATANWHQ